MTRSQERRYHTWLPDGKDKIHPNTAIRQNLPPYQVFGIISIGDYWYEHDGRNFTGVSWPIILPF